jgi:hypothetical protein
MEVTRQHVVEALRRAGLWEEAAEAEAALPESTELEEMAKYCAAFGISQDRLVSLLGGSP